LGGKSDVNASGRPHDAAGLTYEKLADQISKQSIGKALERLKEEEMQRVLPGLRGSCKSTCPLGIPGQRKKGFQ